MLTCFGGWMRPETHLLRTQCSILGSGRLFESWGLEFLMLLRHSSEEDCGTLLTSSFLPCCWLLKRIDLKQHTFLPGCAASTEAQSSSANYSRTRNFSSITLANLSSWCYSGVSLYWWTVGSHKCHLLCNFTGLQWSLKIHLGKQWSEPELWWLFSSAFAWRRHIL